ncbi:MAG: cobyrinate a,c-diamide synthase [Hyphomicrobiales bacterium]|nr:cobyrinate a,c-diamide synthase [Hyphomicrobiales bacterium]MDE2017984.1 cobyrinate a,c-diamide synthase [Hyphomicrobiales bacterium]
MIPGIVVAAPRSGAGKTTLALGLMRAMAREGIAVVGLKSGPDYIDPAFHAAATGRPSVNLDTWAMAPDLFAATAARATLGAEIAICEGAMGLFDGAPTPPGGRGSSADVAAAFGWPVVLVLDASGQAQTAAAVALGCRALDPRLSLAGIVLNNVASERHARLARGAIEEAGIAVFGALPRRTDLALPERHLGLVQAAETAGLGAKLDALADFVADHVDLAALRGAARASTMSAPTDASPALPPPGGRIALARDAAFGFVYPHVLDGWRRAGAEIVAFSPLEDEPPPSDCDACWLPGGYPELHAGRLAAAARFRAGLVAFAARAPVHGECGGFMALGRGLIDAQGARHEMAGLLDVETDFSVRRMNLGYRVATLAADGPMGSAGTTLCGHEFHYARVAKAGDDPPFAFVADAHGGAPAPHGARRGPVTGSWFHAIAMVRPPAR